MKIDIVSGFLGAGKTTLIKKLIREAYAGEKVVLIENEFGEIGIDGGFLQDSGVNVTEMNSGCICCSLVGDFSKALQEVAATYSPDRIIIEPSGVGKLSDVIKAVENANVAGASLNAFCTVVDAAKCKMYMKNFGEFFNEQVQNASCILLSHTDKTTSDKLEIAVELLRAKNPTAILVTAPWDSLDGKAVLAAIERTDSLQAELDRMHEELVHGECDDPDCCCHHHAPHHDHEECDHGHHHHDHEECDHGHHHHDHERHHHHHHHADEVFTSWGKETVRRYTKADVEKVLAALKNSEVYGTVLRAKGIVAGESGWIHFDYVPDEADVREGSAGVIGRLCVIGCQLNEDALAALFE